MKIYGIKPWTGEAPVLTGRVFSPETEPFCDRPYAPINCYPWAPEGYCPEARAYLGYMKDSLLVLMCAMEQQIIAAQTAFGGAVCRDSCLEFFLNPMPTLQDEYVNVEVNCAGVMHIAFGEGRHNRRVLKSMPEGVNVSCSRHDGNWWAVSYQLPVALLGGCEPEMQANFYTCDETLHEHYGCWNPVSAPQPDFHRPECFGLLRLED